MRWLVDAVEVEGPENTKGCGSVPKCLITDRGGYSSTKINDNNSKYFINTEQYHVKENNYF